MSEESDKDWLKYSGERERTPNDKQRFIVRALLKRDTVILL